jgi:hypothetical protein
MFIYFPNFLAEHFSTTFAGGLHLPSVVINETLEHAFVA